jgi:hypothetical protein
MEQTYFAEAFEIGYYLFTNSDPQDLNVASAGEYYINNTNIEVDNNGKIIRINNNLTGEDSEYVDTNHNFYGGDTFINRFSVKRKHSFFKNNSYELPDSTDVNYSLYPNVGYPTYFFNTQENSKKDLYYNFVDSIGDPLNLSLINKKIKNLGESYDNLLNIIKGQFLNPYNYLKAPNNKLDCGGTIADNLFSFSPIKGYIYTYYYGIPYFLVESDINLDLRDSSDTDSEFYPKQSNLDLWLQDDYNRFTREDTYIYDASFSKQSTEKKSLVQDKLFKGDKEHLINKEQRIIYSPESAELEALNIYDRYLVNKPLDYYDFSYSLGKLKGIEPIENNILLTRFEKGLKLFNSFIEVETNIGQVNLSSGRLFKSKPQEYFKSDFGFIGSEENSFMSTPFGHVVVDQKRGDIFLLNQGGKSMDMLSKSQLSNWFKQNLPIELSKHFPEIEDNSLNLSGITLGFDNRFATLYVTKIDYKPKTKLEFRNNKFYLPESTTEVNLNNVKYFKNLSWTNSYSFKKKEWIGFHSFIPNSYISYPNHFDTFIKGNTKSSFWKHNISNKSYLTYYGRTYPFMIDVQQTGKLHSEIVKDVSYFADSIKYFNDFDSKYLDHSGFNEAVVYNKNQNSGLLKFNYHDNNNLSFNSLFPINNLVTSSLIPIRSKENKFFFNQFKNLSKVEGLNWKLSDNGVVKEINSENMNYFDNSINNNYIRGQINNVRLISYETQFKIIFKGLMINGKISGR